MLHETIVQNGTIENSCVAGDRGYAFFFSKNDTLIIMLYCHLNRVCCQKFISILNLYARYDMDLLNNDANRTFCAVTFMYYKTNIASVISKARKFFFATTLVLMDFENISKSVSECV